MGLFSRWFGSRDDVPDWAGFFSPQHYRAFMGAVESEMKRRGLVYELNNGVIRVFRHGREHSDFGLLNLAQMCHGSHQNTWSSAITSHFNNLLNQLEQSDEFDRRAENLENIRSMIKVRLYPSDHVTQLGSDKLIYKVVADGLIEAVVVDLPTTVQSLPPKRLDQWKCSADDLFSIGLANIKAEGRMTPQTQDIGKKVTLQVLVGESFFVASHALFLGEYLGPSAPYGAVVSVPHRHMVVYHPIMDMRAALAINSMIQGTLGMYKEGPGSISPNLYWWKEGRFLHLPSQVTAKEIKFFPPNVFMDEVLNRLPAPAE